MWLTAIAFTALIGSLILRFAPTAAQAPTWAIGTTLNVGMAVACGAVLVWYGPGARLPAVAFTGAVAISLTLNLLVVADRGLGIFASLASEAGVGGLAALDIVTAVVAFGGLLLLFLIGAPLGWIARLWHAPATLQNG